MPRAPRTISTGDQQSRYDNYFSSGPEGHNHDGKNSRLVQLYSPMSIGARAYLSTEQLNLDDNTPTLVTLDSVSYDTNKLFSASSHAITVPVGGYYFVQGRVVFVSTSVVATKKYVVYVYVNGVQKLYNASHSSVINNVGIQAADVLHLNAGDVVTLLALANTGTTQCDLSSGDSVNNLTVYCLAQDITS